MSTEASERERARRLLSFGAAWFPIPGYLELKKCPTCGETALEGETVCSRCGCEPGDDSTWREER